MIQLLLSSIPVDAAALLVSDAEHNRWRQRAQLVSMHPRLVAEASVRVDGRGTRGQLGKGLSKPGYAFAP